MRTLALLSLICLPAFSQDVLYKRKGSTPFGFFGLTVVTIGDVDQDGIEDWAAGNGGREPYWFQDGEVHVYSGASGANLFTLKGGVGEDGFGTTLDAAGDVDGDGTPDLVVGAPADMRYLPGRLGTAWVFSGKTGAALYEWPAPGNVNGTQGWAVAGAGDVNQDGYDDVAVTEEGHGQGDTYVRIYSGFDGSVLREIITSHWSGFGLELENLGDVDGDGVPDLAIASPFYGQIQRGIVDVVSGATGDRLYQVAGQEDFGRLGWSLARTEDIDRDGAPDFLLGAPGAGNGGRAELRSGASGALLWERAPINNGSFGTMVTQVGDLDGDGIGELAIGDPSWGGGEVRIYSHVGGQALLRWQSGGFAAYGFSLAALNDLDGDGFDDLVISLPFREQGVVHVVSTRPLVGQTYCGPANANSTGGFASLTAHGSGAVEDTDLVLRATGLPPQRPTLWLVGDTQGFIGGVGGGQGNLCLAGTFARFDDQLRIAPDSGLLIEPIDSEALPFNPPHAVQPGETWNFQAWYRDANPGLTSNLTDAVSVTFH